MVDSLKEIVQENKKSLKSYIDSFMQVGIYVEGAENGLKWWIFKNGLWHNYPFLPKTWRKKVKTIQEMMNMDQSYMKLEEKLNTRFNKPTFAGSNSRHIPERSPTMDRQLWLRFVRLVR